MSLEIILALSVPFFLALIGIEYYLAKKKLFQYFHYEATILNLSVGILERWLDVFLAGLYYFIFQYVHTHFGLLQIQSSPLTWILLFLGTDFIWYWYHRLSHEINIFWAAHVVHHQSEDFNLTVSARITAIQSLLRHSFWIVLPFIGFPAQMVSIVLLIHGLYPFFIHTRIIGKLGWIEKIFVTPSHHRVHHASNEKYLDKNYGDILIIWDKLFGTFAEEKEEPVYGLTHPLKSNSFLWQHFHYFLEIWLEVKKQRSFRQQLKVFFGSPMLLSENNRTILEKKFRIKSFSKSHRPWKTYINCQIIFALILLVVFYLFHGALPNQVKILLTLLVLLTLINCGAILEKRRWIFYLEIIRIFILLFILKFFFYPAFVYLIIAIVVVISIFAFEYFERWYFRIVFKQG